eukprot:3571046-Karenia_brevis.AAC.1
MLGISRRRFREGCVRKVFTPPADLQGRVGAVRCKQGNADVCPIVMYQAQDASSKSANGQLVVKAIIEWVHAKFLSQLPRMCLLVLLTDDPSGFI